MEEEKVVKENTKWLKVYLDNYNEKSKEALEIEGFLNSTYNGEKYVPWATMERLLYTQDPNAEFIVIKNENGGCVFTDTCRQYNESISGDKRILTDATAQSHFVRVKVTFLGKSITEDYAILDKDYSSLKVYDQAAVNKAIKRAMAKAASRVSGLALKLYEKMDLQFEDESNPKSKNAEELVKNIKNEKVKVSRPEKSSNIKEVMEESVKESDEKVNEITEVNSDEYSPEILNVCKLIKENDRDKINIILQKLNPVILKKYKVVINPEDDGKDLCDKLSKLNDINLVGTAIKKMLEV